MKIDILTLFPEMFEALNHSILSRAQKSGLIDINAINIRDFSLDNNKRCDDYSYGGGAGMIMTPQPLFDAINSVRTDKSYVIFMSPRGKTLTQQKVEELAKMDKNLVVVCGHYEGIDERIVDLLVDEELSIGDYVLTGGEIPAMVLVDAVSRYIPGVLGNDDTTQIESFSNGLLEYPQYTRPYDFMGEKVPDILISGDHKKVDEWRLAKSLEITKLQRPDLYEKYILKNGNPTLKTKKKKKWCL